VMTYHDVLRSVSEATGIPIPDIVGKQRVQAIADARMAVCVGLRRRGMSIPEIGKTVGREASAIRYCIRESYKRVSVDRKFRELLEVVT
jgi:chromosomal replication initiation ATPase DnaA